MYEDFLNVINKYIYNGSAFTAMYRTESNLILTSEIYNQSLLVFSKLTSFVAFRTSNSELLKYVDCMPVKKNFKYLKSAK